MAEKQRSSTKFGILNRFTKTETMLMLQKAYDDKTMKKTAMYKWYVQFLDGQENICDEEQ